MGSQKTVLSASAQVLSPSDAILPEDGSPSLLALCILVLGTIVFRAGSETSPCLCAKTELLKKYFWSFIGGG
jgi:hypothetical protein